MSCEVLWFDSNDLLLGENFPVRCNGNRIYCESYTMCDTSRNACDHEAYPVEGYFTCIKCSHVIDENVYYETDFQQKPSSETHYDQQHVHDPVTKTISRFQDEKRFKPLLDFASRSGIAIRLVEDAYHLFKKTEKRLIEASQSIKSPLPLLFACVYKIMQENECSWTLREIAGHTTLNCSTIAKCYHQHLDTDFTLKPIFLIERFCSKLNMPKPAIACIYRRLENHPLNHFSSRNPATVAAAMIRMYCVENKLKITMKQIAETCGISPISVTRLLRELNKKANT